MLGRTGRTVSVAGLGTWQLGADWGEVTDASALAVLDAAAGAGVTFLDTADVYGDGRSERLIGRFLAANPGLPMTVATKMGRRVPQDPAQYTLANFRAWTDRSRANLGTETLDLVQLHCPPAPVFSTDAVYDALDTLVAEGRVAAYGVSVETCAEALAAIARPGTASVQIIFNAFRRRPLDEVLPAAEAAGVGIIARVPLASGLLSGRYTHRPRSMPPITAATTGMARRSTWGRRFPGWTSTPVSTRRVSSPPCCRPASPRHRPRGAGSSSSRGAPPRSRAHGTRNRRGRTPPRRACRR